MRWWPAKRRSIAGAAMLLAALATSTVLAFAQVSVHPEQTPREKTQVEQLLKDGTDAYRRNDFDAAISLFQQAVKTDPASLKAHLYLATAYEATYIPAGPSNENVARARMAKEEFTTALQIEPKSLPAMDGIALMLFYLAEEPYDEQGFVESRSYHLKHIELKPDDPTPYYWVGLINWTIAFKANSLLRRQYTAADGAAQLKDSDPLPASLCAQFQGQYGGTVDEGIAALKKAIELQPDYDNAMAYLNLLYRLKADEYTDPGDRARYIQLADELIEKFKEIKTEKAGVKAKP